MLAAGATSVDEIARACRVSRGYFINACSATTGAPPHQCPLEQRIAAPQHMPAHRGWTRPRSAAP
ncbi:helix-turn-helix transcriptional regulator [Burkholderia pseudomallei]|uniref:helix-turn-helix transcriptional regulator n=1 Tax=Burkholderia pseudomallei TaxID=28450 RepID=UPI0021562088|nr:helix-turn-helix transcriptional regulator [Burkholderia pseudomallei]